MIIICPQCESRYLVQSSSIGEGKKVKCTNCKHVWLQKPESDSEKATEEAQNPRNQLSDSDFIPQAVRPDHSAGATASDAKHGFPLYSFLAIFGVFILLLAAFIGLKGMMISSVPGMAKVYEGLGLYEMQTEPDMLFDQVFVERQGEEFIIEGSIINLLNKGRTIPYIEVAALDENGVILEDPLYIVLSPNVIEAESIRSFSFSYPKVKEISDFELRFVMQPMSEPVSVSENEHGMIEQGEEEHHSNEHH